MEWRHTVLRARLYEMEEVTAADAVKLARGDQPPFTELHMALIRSASFSRASALLIEYSGTASTPAGSAQVNFLLLPLVTPLIERAAALVLILVPLGIPVRSAKARVTLRIMYG